MEQKTDPSLKVVIVLCVCLLVVFLFIIFSETACTEKAEILGLEWQYSPMTGCWFNTPEGWFPLAHWVVR